MKTRPNWMTAMISAPTTVPLMVPCPPVRLAPPMKTAATA
jgi:hypothetical protein